MPYSAGLTSIQWAREATAGTDLAATSKVVTENWNFVPEDELFRPAIQRGLLQRYRGGEFAIKRWTSWTAEGPWNYEQGQHWASMVVANVAAPTGAGPFIWDHIRNPAVLPTLATMTLERRETDGATPIDHAWHYNMCQNLTLSYADGEILRYNATGFGRRVQTEAQTAALTLPTPELAPPGTARMWIDSTWATLGTTLVAAQIDGATIEIGSGAVPLWKSDGRSDLDFSLHGIDPAQAFVNLTVMAQVGAQTAIEKTAAEAHTLRAVRLQFDGTGGRQLQIDMLMKHEKGSVFEFGERDGQRTVQYVMNESSDGTNFLKMKITNNVATFV